MSKSSSTTPQSITDSAPSSTRVLIFSLVFPPDGVSTAQLLGEIATDLSALDFDVDVITSRPHYNVDEAAALSQPISWRWHRLYGTSQLGNVRVTHLNMPAKAQRAPGRILQWTWFHIGSLILGLRMKADVALTVSPPPTVAIACSLLHKLGGPPFAFCVWELYPDILVSLDKIAADSKWLRPLKAIERTTYRQAHRISVLHEGMRDAVLKTSPDVASKLSVIPTFADVDFLSPQPHNTDLRDKLGLGDRFVVGYAGNIGPAQNLGLVIKAAELVGDGPDIAWVFCGDGHDRSTLEELADTAGLSNVFFTGHLPYEMVPDIYAAFDVSVVALAEGVANEALPSKVYRTMACGKPILAIAAAGSSLATFVETHRVGFCVDPSDPQPFAELVKDCMQERSEVASIGRHARLRAESDFSRKAITARYADMLVSIARKDP